MRSNSNKPALRAVPATPDKTQPPLTAVSDLERQQRPDLSKVYDRLLMIDSLAAIVVDGLCERANADDADPALIHYANAVQIIRDELSKAYRAIDEGGMAQGDES